MVNIDEISSFEITTDDELSVGQYPASELTPTFSDGFINMVLKNLVINDLDNHCQALAYKIPEENISSEVVTAAETTWITSLLNLNDNCLAKIFKNLQLIDQINLAQTCQRLQNVFVMLSKTEYHNFDLDNLNHLDLKDIRRFLNMAGPYIKALCGQVETEDIGAIMDCLGIFCTNVVFLDIYNTNLNHLLLQMLLKNMYLLTKLKLVRADLDDDCIALLTNLPNLRTLSLEANNKLTGAFIQNLPGVEFLCLKDCCNITTDHFAEICQNLTSLNTLDICNCSNLKMANYDEIVKHLSWLETLKISNDFTLVPELAQLPKLKHLYIEDRVECLEAEFLEQLAKHLANRLETLVVQECNWLNQNVVTSLVKLKQLKKLICPNNSITLDDECLKQLATLENLEVMDLSDCLSFTNDGLLELIKGCSKLHMLNIERCNQINFVFANKVLDLLQDSDALTARRRPFAIKALGSDIHHFHVNISKFKTANDFLKFQFYEAPNPCDEAISDDMQHANFELESVYTENNEDYVAENDGEEFYSENDYEDYINDFEHRLNGTQYYNHDYDNRRYNFRNFEYLNNVFDNQYYMPRFQPDFM